MKNQFESLLPGLTQTLILGPRVDDRRRLDLVSNNPYQNPETRENPPISDELIIKIDEQMVEWDRILTKYQKKIGEEDPKNYAPRSDEETVRLTRNIIIELFPEIETVVSENREHVFFHGMPLEEYINEIGIKNTLQYRQSLIDNLPERSSIMFTADKAQQRKGKKDISHEETNINYHQQLILEDELQYIENLPDLVKSYRGNNPIFPIETNDPNEKYKRRVDHEVMTLLSALYVTSIMELSKKPEEDTLPAFVQILSRAFPDEGKMIYLLIGLGSDGTCQRMAVHNNLAATRSLRVDGKYDAADVHSIREIQAVIDVKTNKLWEDLDYEEKSRGRKNTVRFFTIHEDREKTLESETCKAYRDRAMPPDDRRGARIIINDLEYLDIYLQVLRKKMKGWTIEEETVESQSPQRSIPHNRKYFAYPNNNPEHKVELDIEWLQSKKIEIGSWVQKRYETFAGRNAHAYKMKEMIDQIYPLFFPKEIYNIDWSSNEIITDLIDYSNKKALGQL